ncbi:MAG: hypothetical protein IKD93_06710 [Firmicutes bacterium]|nr:hypothetical protein [Bacillota bacterium]
MDASEILAKSRQENRGHDEREKAATARAAQRGAAVGGLVCSLIIIINAVTGNWASPATWAVWAVYLSITGTTLLLKYRELRQRHELVCGLMELALAVTFFVFYLIRLRG